MSRIDRRKRAVGTAVRRTAPSRAATLVVEKGLMSGRVLDYGCGFGFDADHFGWDGYDPFYRPAPPRPPYDRVFCGLVLNVLSRNRRAEVLSVIRDLLAHDGRAFLAVPRDIPTTGKLGVQHSLQNYVVFTLPSLFVDESIELYEMKKDSSFEDRTQDYVSRRDRVRAR